VDARIIQNTRTGIIQVKEEVSTADVPKFKIRRLPEDSYKLGIITDISQVGGYPEYKGTPRSDKDNDGMPDSWEIKYGLDPDNAADATGDCNGDGYTNIEKYINGMNPKIKIDWTKAKNNFDTLASKKGDLAD